MASFFLNREGNISAFKIGIAAAVIGGVMLVVGLILTQIEQATFKAPLDVELPANTTLVGEERLTDVSKRVFYETSESPEAVARFYDEALAKFQGIDVSDANRDRCIRFPREGEVDNYQEGNGIVPYQFTCLFQSISLAQGVDRTTQVTIQPGVRNNETGMDNLNTTRIEYEQYWQP